MYIQKQIVQIITKLFLLLKRKLYKCVARLSYIIYHYTCIFVWLYTKKGEYFVIWFVISKKKNILVYCYYCKYPNYLTCLRRIKMPLHIHVCEIWNLDIKDCRPECWEAWGPEFNLRPGRVLYKLWQPPKSFIFYSLLSASQL